MRGAGLLEALCAMALLAVACLTLCEAHVAAARMRREADWQARALWLADSRAEAEYAGAGVSIDWAARAAELPGGTGAIARGTGARAFARRGAL